VAVSGSEPPPRTVADLVTDIRAAQARMSTGNAHRALFVECERALTWLSMLVASQKDHIESLERV
jgi:hypothetical protein